MVRFKLPRCRVRCQSLLVDMLFLISHLILLEKKSDGAISSHLVLHVKINTIFFIYFVILFWYSKQDHRQYERITLPLTHDTGMKFQLN